MSVASRLTDRLWQLDLGSVNAYLLDDGAVTLVDAGTPGSVDDLTQGLDEAGYDTEDIDRVLITHFDIDHVGGLAALDLSATVYAMEPDASMLTGERKPPLANRKGLLQRMTWIMLTHPSGPITRVTDEETIDGFRAYHTPGHTPGHATFHHQEEGVAFLGDLVSGEDGRLGTVSWLLAYDGTEVRESIRDLAGRDLEFDIACMGHGDPLTSGGATALRTLAEG